MADARCLGLPLPKIPIMHGITGLTPVWLIFAATASLILVYVVKRGQWKKQNGNRQEAARVRRAVNVDTEEKKPDAVAMQGEPAVEPKGPEPLKRGGKPRGATLRGADWG